MVKTHIMDKENKMIKFLDLEKVNNLLEARLISVMTRKNGGQIMRKQYLYNLDLLRSLFCIMILFFHAVIHKAWHINSSFWTNEFLASAVFMDAFFLLSGFVLFYLYSSKDYSDYTNLKFFYVRRLLKIYPLYILHTIIWCLLYQQFYPSVLPSIVLGISSFFPTLFGKMGIGGTWFISVIFFCYFCFPVLSGVIKNKKIITLLLLMLFSYLFVVYVNVLAVNWKISKFSVYVNPIYRLLMFFIGMCVSGIFMQISERKHKHVHLSVVVLVAISLVYLISELYHFKFIGEVKFAINWTFYSCVTIPLFALLIYSCADCRNGFLTSLSKSCVIQHFSKISFPFYLAQAFSIYLYKTYFSVSVVWQQIVIIFAITYIIALCYHLSINVLNNYIFDKVSYKKVQ